MSSFINLFDNLIAPKDLNSGLEIFNSSMIPGYSKSHIGKDSQGRPVIILGILHEVSVMPQAIALENLRVEHNVRCKISPSSGPEIDGRFSLIHCLSKERCLHVYFLQVMDVLLQSLSDDSTATELSLAINKLAELFHSLRKPPSRTIQGLWAELFLIIQSNSPQVLIKSWHSDVAERYDFSSGNQCIEVKCSGNRERQHYFSFEQAYPPPNTSVLVASLFVEPASNGATLGGLWDRVRDLAFGNTDLRMKIESVCLAALGTSWHNARQKAYDEELAYHSLAFFDVNDIPRVSKRHPNGVSDIRFRSDFSRAKAIIPKVYRNSGLLFDACIPT